MGGLMSITGLRSKGCGSASRSTILCGLLLAQGCDAVIEREKSGEGNGSTPHARSADLHARLPGVALAAGREVAKALPATTPDRHQPRPGCFRRRRQINIAARETIVERFCEAADGQTSAERPIPTDQGARRTARRSTRRSPNHQRREAYWVEGMERRACRAGRSIRSIRFRDPQVQHLEMARPGRSPKLGQLKVVRPAINNDADAGAGAIAPTGFGEHTDEILVSSGSTTRHRPICRKGRGVDGL